MKVNIQLKRRLPWWLRLRFRRCFLAGGVVLALLLFVYCRRTPDAPYSPPWSVPPEAKKDRRPPPKSWGQPPRVVPMTVTAYSADAESTGWEYNDSGVPVYSYGPNKGRTKEVGITAEGTMAYKGTIAADTDYYPFGTRMFVPGYGWGTIHDRGGAIRSPHRIDVFFPTRDEALEWGRQHLDVTVILPAKKAGR